MKSNKKERGLLISATVLELKFMCSLAIRLWQQQNDTVAQNKAARLLTVRPSVRPSNSLHVRPSVCPVRQSHEILVNKYL